MRESKDLLLAIDQGTQSVRAMIFDAGGELLAKSQVHIQPYFSRAPGWAEQDCGYYWTNLCEACQGLWRTHPEYKPRIAGMSVTTQRSVTVCLDENRKPLRPAVSWLDQRRTSQYPALPLWLEAGLRAAGQRRAIHYFQSRAECNWLAADDAALWARTRHFLFLSGYFHLRLTGQLRDAVASK